MAGKNLNAYYIHMLYIASMLGSFSILYPDLLESYLDKTPKQLKQAFEDLHDAELSTNTFSFYTSVASVYSSRIEGEVVDLDSYVKHKRDDIAFQKDYTKKIDDLYDAYSFASGHKLNEEGIKNAHALLSKNILSKHLQGQLRTQNMYVSTSDGRIEYVAASPFEVKAEMEKFYQDLETLLTHEMGIYEVFYYAAMLHLVFVKIHPWNDGNGRCARLIEKWFIAQKLGEKAWFMQSEKHYYDNHALYYKNIRNLGLEYPELDYSKALPFLLMLPDGLVTKMASHL